MITTTPCDNGHHKDCSGYGLAHGAIAERSDNYGATVCVRVPCECPCHILVNPPRSKPKSFART